MPQITVFQNVRVLVVWRTAYSVVAYFIGGDLRRPHRLEFAEPDFATRQRVYNGLLKSQLRLRPLTIVSTDGLSRISLGITELEASFAAPSMSNH